MSERLAAIVRPETRPVDELWVAGPVDRITRADPLEVEDGAVVVPYRPHEVVTVVAR
jgi:hypothetical protein